ncbi:DUF3450 domain-containing protein [Pseudoalteromonas rhizosphaerae]|uniref:DUF3450 domain-containing protein n=1 Tax=Pseudoalteromonas rhizosphaerae TaxID=2518973 RepID=UPI0021494CA1|nr:DUF3450 domain-containing protein [Pseudoalteromonas rhizosphaerae]
MQRCIKSVGAVILLSSFSSLADPVSELENLVNQWLQIEQQTSELETHWLEKKTSMQQTLILLDAEQTQLKQLNQNRQKNTSELAEKRTALIKKQSQLETDENALNSQLIQLSQQLRSLQVQLPPPLLASWQSIGDLDNESLDANEKLQIALKMLGQLADFQNRISIHEMAISNSEGKEIWVKQLYLGAAQAWFVSNDLSYAGIGFPSELGWQWQFDTEIDGEQIAHGIAVQEKKQAAHWLTLPVFSYAAKELTQ